MTYSRRLAHIREASTQIDLNTYNGYYDKLVRMMILDVDIV